MKNQMANQRQNTHTHEAEKNKGKTKRKKDKKKIVVIKLALSQFAGGVLGFLTLTLTLLVGRSWFTVTVFG